MRWLRIVVTLSMLCCVGCGGCGAGERGKNKDKDMPKAAEVRE